MVEVRQYRTGNAFETKSTLDFASRAKKVVNRAVQNEIADKSALLDQYKSEIEELRRRLESGEGGTQARLATQCRAPTITPFSSEISPSSKANSSREHVTRFNSVGV